MFGKNINLVWPMLDIPPPANQNVRFLVRQIRCGSGLMLWDRQLSDEYRVPRSLRLLRLTKQDVYPRVEQKPLR